jgi:hypothetical protein
MSAMLNILAKSYVEPGCEKNTEPRHFMLPVSLTNQNLNQQVGLENT